MAWARTSRCSPRNAERIELCLFDPTGRREIARLDLPECTDEIWHGYLPNARTGLIYGYRAHGPYSPQDGHRFNPHKLLLDPYARPFAGSAALVRCACSATASIRRGRIFRCDRRDSAPRHAESGCERRRLRLGRRSSAQHSVVATPSSMRRMCAA